MRKGILKRIKLLEIQGAASIAVESLKHLKEFARKNGFGSKFDYECKSLLFARPTAVALHNVIAELRKERSVARIDSLLERIKASREKIAKSGVKLFSGRKAVMTHCHSSDVISLLKHSRGRIRNVYATETRPMHQGIRTVNELASFMNVTLITDSAIGYYMNDADFVLVGADAIRKEGLINKIGTLPLAVVAKEFSKPLYVAASSLKFDRRRNIRIEMRNPGEIHEKIRNVRIINPAFDITPWKYVAGIVTEDGIITPRQVKRLLA